MFIQTETTPNPETIKFLPGQVVAGDSGPFDFESGSDLSISRLAQTLFDLGDVDRVFFGADFISVTKSVDREWKQLRPMVLAAIMDHFIAGFPIVNMDASADDEDPAEESYEGEAAEIVAEIRELIDTRVRPAVAQDGGDIVFDRFEVDTGIVHLHMRGACAGCPASSYTLKQGIENMLKAYVPEVTAVEAVL
ncbi:MAG: NifU family protein [Pseudomonadota bacterium]